jgi:hypothetical protein
MAKVVITELVSGEVATAANANATITSWTTNDVNIDHENIRQEGLDRRSFAKTFQVFGSSVEATSVDGNLNPSPIASTSVIELATPLHVGGFTVSSSAKIVVRCSVEIAVQNAAAGRMLSLQLGIKSGSGGIAAAIVKTLRTIDSVTTGPWDQYYPFTWTHMYNNNIITDLYFTLMAGTNAAGGDTFTLRNAFITAIQYQRSS